MSVRNGDFDIENIKTKGIQNFGDSRNIVQVLKGISMKVFQFYLQADTEVITKPFDLPNQKYKVGLINNKIMTMRHVYGSYVICAY